MSIHEMLREIEIIKTKLTTHNMGMMERQNLEVALIMLQDEVIKQLLRSAA